LQIVFAFTLGALTITGIVQFWQIAALAMLAGITLSFDQPTRFALIPRLVPREDLSNAIALNAIIFNGAAIVGPALGGALVAIIGYAGNFFLNGLSYVAVLVALLLMRFPKVDAEGRGTLFSDARRGLGYIFREQLLADLLTNYGSLMFFAATYTVLLALVGVAVLGTTPEELGVLYTAIGIGTIVGSLGVASLGNFAYKGRLLMVTSLVMSVSVILFSQLHFCGVSFAC
jgi:predicted MFS family arabinose efflux permease